MTHPTSELVVEGDEKFSIEKVGQPPPCLPACPAHPQALTLTPINLLCIMLYLRALPLSPAFASSPTLLLL